MLITLWFFAIYIYAFTAKWGGWSDTAKIGTIAATKNKPA